MSKIIPVTAWAALRKKGNEIPLHSHDYYEMVFYETGMGYGSVGGERYRFSSGKLLLIPPEIPHDEFHESGGRLICIGFRTDSETPTGLFADVNRRIERLAGDIVYEVSKQKYKYRRMLELKTEEMILTVERMSGGEGASAKDFEYAAEYLRGNCHEKISLSEVAAQMNLSSDYFRHRFREQNGMSPQRYLVFSRLKKAERLLSETELSCTEIAGRCGFSDSSQFSMLFRREYHMTAERIQKEKIV